MTIVPVKNFWFNKTIKILTRPQAHLFGLLVAASPAKVFLLKKTSGEFHCGFPPQNKTDLSAVSRPTPKCTKIKIEKTLAANSTPEPVQIILGLTR